MQGNAVRFVTTKGELLEVLSHLNDILPVKYVKNEHCRAPELLVFKTPDEDPEFFRLIGQHQSGTMYEIVEEDFKVVGETIHLKTKEGGISYLPYGQNVWVDSLSLHSGGISEKKEPGWDGLCWTEINTISKTETAQLMFSTIKKYIRKHFLSCQTFYASPHIVEQLDVIRMFAGKANPQGILQLNDEIRQAAEKKGIALDG